MVILHAFFTSPGMEILGSPMSIPTPCLSSLSSLHRHYWLSPDLNIYSIFLFAQLLFKRYLSGASCMLKTNARSLGWMIGLFLWVRGHYDRGRVKTCCLIQNWCQVPLPFSHHCSFSLQSNTRKKGPWWAAKCWEMPPTVPCILHTLNTCATLSWDKFKLSMSY